MTNLIFVPLNHSAHHNKLPHVCDKIIQCIYKYITFLKSFVTSTFQKFGAGTGTVDKMKRTPCFLGQQEMKRRDVFDFWCSVIRVTK